MNYAQISLMMIKYDLLYSHFILRAFIIANHPTKEVAPQKVAYPRWVSGVR